MFLDCCRNIKKTSFWKKIKTAERNVLAMLSLNMLQNIISKDS